jgi:hypothetical protein
VVIVEDAHWADDASLDIIRHLAGRIDRLPAMLVVSYRDEELTDDHPFRRIIGALAGPAVLHLASRRRWPGCGPPRGSAEPTGPGGPPGCRGAAGPGWWP